MFGIEMPELLVILAVALIVLGPKKLPELARSIGKGLAEFKKSTEDLKDNFNLGEDLKEVQQDLKEVQRDLKDMVDPSHYLEPYESLPSPPDHQEEKIEANPIPETPTPSASKAPDA